MPEDAVLILEAISPLHNGAGESLGVIDRPIMRERPTNFPILQGASIKGVLRDEFRRILTDTDGSNLVKAFFGPEPGHGAEHAGAVSFGEGKLLAFPIRSLRGPFVWAASPLIMHRFAETLKICRMPLGQVVESFVTNLLPLDNILIPKGGEDILIGSENDKRVLLEEFSFQVAEANISIELACINKAVGMLIFNSEENFMSKHFMKRLILLPDDIFGYFLTHATEVMPNIQIVASKGTTKKGSLRYTEYLPEETILYSLIGFEASRGPVEMDKNAVAQQFMASLPSQSAEPNDGTAVRKIPDILQIGADETIGKGRVRLNMAWQGE